MITIAGRGCGWSMHTRAVSQSVGARSVLPPLTSLMDDDIDRNNWSPPVVPHDHQHDPIHVEIVSPPKAFNAYSLSNTLIRRQLKVSGGIGVSHQFRYAHTDIQIPDFTPYRRPSTKDPHKKNEDSIDSRRAFTYIMTAGVGIGAAVSGKNIVQTLVMALAPAKDVLAMAKIEVNINDIPEGKNMVFKWRGKPLFVRHRTAEEISRERSTDITQLRDPQADEERSPTGQWLVLVGVCTHLGCVPIANQGDYGGYYCPCHGSHYDASGRIRKGPAPLNLEIPEHVFNDNILVVG